VEPLDQCWLNFENKYIVVVCACRGLWFNYTIFVNSEVSFVSSFLLDFSHKARIIFLNEKPSAWLGYVD